MSFDASETSYQDGAPIELFQFKRGTASWVYTSADQSQFYLGQTYAAAPISRDAIDSSSELNRADLSIHGPHDLAVADQFRAYPPGEVVTLNIYQRHRNDVALETRLLWSGRVLTARWRDSQASLICEPITTSLRRGGIPRQYGPQCPHTHYGPGCNVVRADYRLQGVIAAINGAVVSVPVAASQDDGYLVGGYLYWQLPSGLRDARTILEHVGDQVTLTAPLQHAVIGHAVELYPGCNRSLAQCNDRYGNAENHGGWPFMPNTNPFDSKVF